MSITVPTAGSPVLDTWGAAVAGQLNDMIPIVMTADQATNSASAVSVTELVIPVLSGSVYIVQLAGDYQCSATNQGLQMGYSGPGGSGNLALEVWGVSSPTGINRYRTFDGSLTGSTAVATAASNREWWATLRYVCTSSGDLQVKFARGGTSGSTGVTLVAGSGGIALQATP